MTVNEIIAPLEAFAPLQLQESYDNCGLQVGDPHAQVTGALLTLDVTIPVLEEAIARGCNLIIAHHPVIFSGLKKITGKSYVERIVARALREGLNIYAIHTNLDNLAAGVNRKIADKLGLQGPRILSPKQGTLSKLYCYVPATHAETLRQGLFAAGAGAIGRYRECSFSTEGTGTFRGSDEAKPFIGKPGGPRETVAEVKLEVLVPVHLQQRVLRAMREHHPYEEIAYELVSLVNANQEIGAGMIGELPGPLGMNDFLALVRDAMQTGCIRHTEDPGRQIRKVAVCGGSGSFLLRDALAAGADAFVTSDFKYHQFFDAEGRILIADIGHYESEQYTAEILAEVLRENFPNFAVLLSNIQSNPVNYFF